MADFPREVLTGIFAALDDSDLDCASQCCRSWRKAATDPTYWAERCSRDGVGCTPCHGVSHASYYRKFVLLSPGEPQWLVWRDDSDGTWQVNHDLLSLFSRIPGAPTVSVTTCLPTSTHSEEGAAQLLSALMQSSDAFPPQDAMHPLRKGLQVWGNAMRTSQGKCGFFLIPRNWDMSATGEAEIATAQGIQQLIFLLSSSLYVVHDEEQAPSTWWHSLFPPCHPLKKHVLPSLVARPNLCTVIVNSSNSGMVEQDGMTDIPSDGIAELTWLTHHFGPMTAWRVPSLSKTTAEAVAERMTGLRSKSWGEHFPSLHPGILFTNMKAATFTPTDLAELIKSATATLGESAVCGSYPILRREGAFGDDVVGCVLERQVAETTAFYRKAMEVELDLAATNTVTNIQPLPSVKPPMEMQALIEAHEQHLFSSCRKLICHMGGMVVDTQTASKYFELLKNKISDEFRVVWCENQRQSKVYCEAVFDSVFANFTQKYTPEKGGDHHPPAPPCTPVSPNFTHEQPLAFGEDDMPAMYEKTSWVSLRRFYGMFMDLLEEYMMKAIGTRRGDVMLARTTDLMHRVEASTRHNFHPNDLALALQDISKEVSSLVYKEISTMERQRNAMQKTGALYTKVLGMECRQTVIESYQTLLQKRCSLMNEHAKLTRRRYEQLGRATDYDWEDLLHGTLCGLHAEKESVSHEILAYYQTLPLQEQRRHYRFGIVHTELKEDERSGWHNFLSSFRKIHQAMSAAVK